MSRTVLPLLVVASALLGTACNETKTPTEPVLAATAPTPTPTVVPGQPAVLSGKVTWGFGYAPMTDVVVSCQGRSTTTVAGGTYTLEGLTSGPANVTFQELGDPNVLKADATLQP